MKDIQILNEKILGKNILDDIENTDGILRIHLDLAKDFEKQIDDDNSLYSQIKNETLKNSI